MIRTGSGPDVGPRDTVPTGDVLDARAGEVADGVELRTAAVVVHEQPTHVAVQSRKQLPCAAAPTHHAHVVGACVELGALPYVEGGERPHASQRRRRHRGPGAAIPTRGSA